ncbi:MAG: XrtA system polysaccharide chain length determinant [Pseudomonadota bacterium]
MIPKKITPETILDLICRRWFLLAGPLVLCTMIAVAMAVTLPRLYRSETTILVQPQEVPTAYVAPTVTFGVEDRLLSMAQQIMSRSRLIEISKEFSLYPELARNPEEDMIDRMRQDIGVDLGDEEHKDGKGINHFKLSFAYSSPETTMKVTSRLASLFIEENLKIRSQQARLTTEFLDKELADLEARLKIQEANLKTYKQSFMGALPEQMSGNINVAGQLQQELQSNQATLSASRERADLLQKAMADLSQHLEAEGRNTSPITTTGERPTRLDDLRAKLTELSARYTPRYPEIVKVKKEIAKLEAEATEKPTGTTATAPAGPQLRSAANSPLPGMNAQLIEAKADIQRLRRDQLAIKRKLGIYEHRIESTPQREQELATLTRDYEMMQANYQSLLKKRTEAKMAENLEDKQQGEQFRMIDPPNLPERPFKPDLRKLFFVAILSGLAAGVGLTLLLEYLDRTFRQTEEVEEYLGLDILAMIPLVESDEQKSRRTRRRLLLAGVGLFVFLIYAGFIYYAYSHGVVLRLAVLA